MINPKLYLVRLKPGPKENPNLSYHRYFHNKSDMERWVKENETKVKDIHVAPNRMSIWFQFLCFLVLLLPLYV